LPFGVKLGGQDAVVLNEVFSGISSPVAADAEIVVDVEDEMIIINVFPSSEQGETDGSAPPAIILIQGGSQGRLNQTMDGQALKPGWYLMNVVAAGQTSRVLFQVR
jgi:hypothetical protein